MNGFLRVTGGLLESQSSYPHCSLEGSIVEKEKIVCVSECVLEWGLWADSPLNSLYKVSQTLPKLTEGLRNILSPGQFATLNEWGCYYWGKYLATWRKELAHWKRPWCWERLKIGGEGDDRGWDGWMASLTWWSVSCGLAALWDAPWAEKQKQEGQTPSHC